MRSGMLPAAILAVFAALALVGAAGNSPTSDELTHLAAGRSYLATGDFRLNREHPPLLKAIAALPLIATPLFPDPVRASDAHTRMREAWGHAATDNAPQWRFGRIFFFGVTDEALARENGGTNDGFVPTASFGQADFINRTGRLFFRARAMMVLLGVLLGALIFVWSRELWGAAGGVVSLMLFAFDPNFIAHAALVTTDAGVTLFMTATAYFFWRAIRGGRRRESILFAISFALALLSKFSAVLLIPIVIAIVLLSRERIARAAALAALAVITAIGAIWIAYGFRAGDRVDVGSAIHDRAARRAALEAFPSGIRQEDVDRLRTDAPLSALERAVVFADRVNLLPETYLHGFAVTAATSIGRPSFINGRFSFAGFRDYFFWTTIYKLPVITLLAIAAGLAIGWRTEARVFILAPIVIYLGFAIWSRMNIGHRHILPIFPFVYVLCGSLGPYIAAKKKLAIVAGLILAVSANVVFLPRPASLIGHHLSYVNELGGGPLEGYRVVTDSNFDWGQDLKRLGEWLRAHEVREPVNLVYFGNADPAYYGIRYHNLRPARLPVVPGYLAVSTIDYLGVLFAADQRRYWEGFVERTEAKLVGRAGYSILIFRVERLP
ncbi:MAG: glycosyltransferase family 39 protein [Thermoanaerobaculia bacterium]|nr:glycosyltransferase family 39 protein [Thermoanaerobaculia bacterium]